MPKFQNIRQSFSRGVISPRLSARVGLEGYADALKSCKNFIITSQGGAVMREGGEFLGYPAVAGRFRIFQFMRGGEQSDILIEVCPGTIRFWQEIDGVPTVYQYDGADVQLTNPYTDEDLDDLYFVNQDRFGVLVSSNHPPLYMTFFKDGRIEAELFPVENIQNYDYNDADSPKLLVDDNYWRLVVSPAFDYQGWAYTVTYGPGRIYTYSTYDPNNPSHNASEMTRMLQLSADRQGFTGLTLVVTPALDTAGAVIRGAYDVVGTGEGAWRRVLLLPIDDVFSGDGEANGSLRLGAGSAYQPGIPTIEPRNEETTNLITALTEPVWSYPYYVLHNAVYYQCIKTHKTATADNEPGVGTNWTDYWVALTEKPVGYDYTFPSGNEWADIPLGTILSPRDRGWPTVAAFHEQRLVLMANKDNPTAIYGSALNEYQNYVLGANDDQAWLFVLDSSDSPQIKWAVSDRNLLIGTSSGDWVLTAEVTITPTDIQAQRQNAARSKLAKPVQIDKETFYIEQGGRKLRSSSYVRDRQAFTSSNISVFVENLMSNPGIIRLAVQHTPETMMTMVTKTGQLLFMAYEPVTQIIATSEYETDGFVFDVASYFSYYNDWDVTYMAVQRNGLWVLERMIYPRTKNLEQLVANGICMLDSWLTGTVPSNGVITGLDHLEGKDVFVLVDDGWEVGTYTVLEGQVSTNRSSGTYCVGLAYNASFETFEIQDNFQGTGLGTKRRWNSLTTRLLNSALPKVYGQRDRDRTPATPMGDYEGVREGLQDIEQSKFGWGDGSIIVEQDRPYPTHILAFFGSMEVEDR